MTNRAYVESTVAYLAEHVPSFSKALLEKFGIGNGATKLGGRDFSSADRLSIWVGREASYRLDMQHDDDVLDGMPDENYRRLYHKEEGDAWQAAAHWLRTQLHTQGDPPDPLVSADWWEERGERKLADLLRHGPPEKNETEWVSR